MPKLLVELRDDISSRLESEVRRLQPSLKREATKRRIVESALDRYFGLEEHDRGMLVRQDVSETVSHSDPDNPVSCEDAARLLGISVSTVSLIKREAGICRRRVFVREIRQFLQDHPEWTTRSVRASARPRRRKSP